MLDGGRRREARGGGGSGGGANGCNLGVAAYISRYREEVAFRFLASADIDCTGTGGGKAPSAFLGVPLWGDRAWDIILPAHLIHRQSVQIQVPVHSGEFPFCPRLLELCSGKLADTTTGVAGQLLLSD